MSRRRRKKKSRAVPVMLVIIILLAGSLTYVVADTDYLDGFDFSLDTVKEFFSHKYNKPKKKTPEKEEQPKEYSASADEDYGEDSDIQDIINEMSVQEKVAQMFITTPEALTSVHPVLKTGSIMKDKFDEFPVGGLIYDEENFQDAEQTTNMIADLQEYAYSSDHIRLFTAVEEEGGSLSPAAESLGADRLESMYSYASKGTDGAFDNARTIGAYLSGFGLNTDLAPVADVWIDSSHDIIGRRAYGSSYKQVSSLIPSAVKGFHASRTVCVLKHFPGYGKADIDDETGLADTSGSLADLKGTDLKPFMEGADAGADMIMTGNIVNKDVDSFPASISEKWTNDVLRRLIGFDGVIITDDLSDPSIANRYGADEAAVKAVLAGADMVIVTGEIQTAYAAVLEAVNNGVISQSQIEESVMRILKVKKKFGLLGSDYSVRRIKLSDLEKNQEETDTDNDSDSASVTESDSDTDSGSDAKTNNGVSDSSGTSDANGSTSGSSGKSGSSIGDVGP